MCRQGDIYYVEISRISPENSLKGTDSPAKFKKGRKWCHGIGITLMIISWVFFLKFIQSQAVKEHNTVKRHIMQISAPHLIVFKHRGKSVVAGHYSSLSFVKVGT